MQRTYLTQYISRDVYFKLTTEDRRLMRQSLALAQLSEDEHYRYRVQRSIERRVLQAAGLGMLCKSSQCSSTTMPA
jgi:hypothetical protein